MSTAWAHRDLISVKELKRSELELLFEYVAKIQAMKKPYPPVLAGRVLGNLFFEASTRSRMSFGSAFMYLGGMENSTVGVSFSSMSKGETLEDTIRVIAKYVDAIVIRHPDLGSAEVAASVSDVPVINAGDGPGEHPTQALLDAYTIYKEAGRMDDLNVVMVGDLKYGRTIHSLARLLALFSNIKITFVAPDELQVPDELYAFLEANSVQVSKSADLKPNLADADIVYSTRVQRERMSEEQRKEDHESKYQMSLSVMEEFAQSHTRILHPLPRLSEIQTDLDDSPYAAYFRQAENGLYVRMGLFSLLLDAPIS